MIAGNRGWCNPNPYFVASDPYRRRSVGATTSVMLALSKRGRRSFLVIFSPSRGCGRCHPFLPSLVRYWHKAEHGLVQRKGLLMTQSGH